MGDAFDSFVVIDVLLLSFDRHLKIFYKQNTFIVYYTCLEPSMRNHDDLNDALWYCECCDWSSMVIMVGILSLKPEWLNLVLISRYHPLKLYITLLHLLLLDVLDDWLPLEPSIGLICRERHRSDLHWDLLHSQFIHSLQLN